MACTCTGMARAKRHQSDRTLTLEGDLLKPMLPRELVSGKGGAMRFSDRTEQRGCRVEYNVNTGRNHGASRAVMDATNMEQCGAQNMQHEARLRVMLPKTLQRDVPAVFLSLQFRIRPVGNCPGCAPVHSRQYVRLDIVSANVIKRSKRQRSSMVLSKAGWHLLC